MEVSQLQASVTNQGQDWLSVQQDVFRAAEVNVQDDEAILPATVTEARAYLDAIWEWNAEQDPGN